MPEPPFTRIRLAAALTAAVLLLLIVHTREASGVPAGDPIAQGEREVAAARADADAAAAHLQEALAEQVRLADEIARLEREIPVLRLRAASLRDQVRRRAAELYKDFDPHVTFASSEPGAAIDGARHAHLTEKVTEHDTRLAAELRATAERLEAAEAELRVRKTQHDAAVLQLAEERRRLDAHLVRVQVVLDRLRALAAEGAFDGAAGGLVRSGAEVCPVDGAVAFTNDWGAPRSGGRTHEGTDLLAAHGTPLVAVTAGVVTDNSGGLGGIGVDLRGDDGVRYYYAHLSGIARTGRVGTGERIAYVGDTGNAAGNPHLHFQMHPGGGEPVNPYPTLTVLCG